MNQQAVQFQPAVEEKRARKTEWQRKSRSKFKADHGCVWKNIKKAAK